MSYLDPLSQLRGSYLDTNMLLSIFSSYTKPKDKITKLVKDKKLIRIKQGLYMLGKQYKLNYSAETLANMIYGPSYVSMEYALSWYGLIPERVETITSICSKRNKFYKTPVGNFSYKYLNIKKFPIGVEIVIRESGNFCIASREKAICDFAADKKIESIDLVRDFLLEDMRMDVQPLGELDKSLLLQIAKVYKKQSVTNVVDWLIMEVCNE